MTFKRALPMPTALSAIQVDVIKSVMHLTVVHGVSPTLRQVDEFRETFSQTSIDSLIKMGYLKKMRRGAIGVIKDADGNSVRLNFIREDDIYAAA